MNQFLIVISTIFHSLATIIFIGYFFIMLVLIDPILVHNESTGLQMLSEISKRSRWWLYAALGVLALTGVHLTLGDANYSGIGQFNTPWSILMLVKHIVILIMLILGFWFNAIRRVGKGLLSTSNALMAVIRFKRYIFYMSLCGVVILVLTAIGQLM